MKKGDSMDRELRITLKKVRALLRITTDETKKKHLREELKLLKEKCIQQKASA